MEGPDTGIRWSVALAAIAAAVAVVMVAFAWAAARSARDRALLALDGRILGVAHQLRTPLATIKGSCQLLAEELPGPGAARRLDGNAAVR